MDLIFSADGLKFIAKIFFDKHEEFNVQFYTGVVEQFPPIVAYLLYSSISPWWEKILYTWLFPPMVRFLHHVFWLGFHKNYWWKLSKDNNQCFYTLGCNYIYLHTSVQVEFRFAALLYFDGQYWKLNIRIIEYILCRT